MTNTATPANSETAALQRQILLVGPYGVLGSGVIDAVAGNPQWGVTTAARRPAPVYRAQSAPPHISVDLMDREGTKSALSSLGDVTDLVFAAYVEKPTMAETVEPNARMLRNTLDALAASNVPVQRVVLAGGAKSYGFSLGAFNAPAKETDLVSLRRSTTTNKKTFWPTGPLRAGPAGRSCVHIWSWDQA